MLQHFQLEKHHLIQLSDNNVAIALSGFSASSELLKSGESTTGETGMQNGH